MRCSIQSNGIFGEGGKMTRIGVFVCHCGSNIAGVVDMAALEDYAKTLPNVIHAEKNMYTCSSDGLMRIKDAIKKHGLDRVVVASCTPRTHEPLFRSTCSEAGLNPYLFEFVNIREHCSWIHMHDKEKATEKAKDLVRIGVAKAALLEPLNEIKSDVAPSALVIGGGIGGMAAALSLANRGFEVNIVEKEKELGGTLRKIYKVYPTNEYAENVIGPVIADVKEHRRIKVYLSSYPAEIKGYVGNFDVKLNDGEYFKVGTIIVAVGADVLKPDGLYGYGKYRNVITQLELEEMLKNEKASGAKQKRNTAMIQCVGARGQRMTYCSKTCCMVAIKNAVILRELGNTVTILHSDLQAFGEYEMYYKRAKELGVRFVRCSSPEVVEKNGELYVKVQHERLKMEIKQKVDLVVLSTPFIQREGTEGLSKMLKVPMRDGFFAEAHVKLRPLDFATDGIYLCGTAHGPKDVKETITQALGAASRAAIPMEMGFVTVEAIGAQVNDEMCVKCGICVEKCPYGVLRLENEKLVVVDALCKGCGTCVASCPTGAMDQRHFKNRQIEAQIEALYEV